MKTCGELINRDKIFKNFQYAEKYFLGIWQETQQKIPMSKNFMAKFISPFHKNPETLRMTLLLVCIVFCYCFLLSWVSEGWGSGASTVKMPSLDRDDLEKFKKCKVFFEKATKFDKISSLLLTDELVFFVSRCSF